MLDVKLRAMCNILLFANGKKRKNICEEKMVT